MGEAESVLWTADGRPLVLGPRLAAGGEGVVHGLPDRPGLCAKVYYPSARTAERREKLEAMVANPPPEPARVAGHRSLAWPTAILCSGPGGGLAGFLMPRLPAGARTALAFLQPEERNRTHPAFNFRYLLAAGRNLAAAVAAVHQTGCRVGDLNESNTMITGTALVTLIDCDSFQVPLAHGRVAHCPVGRAEYTAPELVGLPPGAVERTPESDAFALAVLLFQLLMQGFHPFSGRWRAPGEPPDITRRIARGAYAYAGHPDIAPPPAAPPAEVLPRAVRAAFERAFGPGVGEPALRPTPREWTETLDGAVRELRPCRLRGEQHLHPRGLRACPWCALAERGLDYFPELVGAQLALPDAAARAAPGSRPPAAEGGGAPPAGGAPRSGPPEPPRPAARPAGGERPRLVLEPPELVFAPLAPGGAAGSGVLTVRNLGPTAFHGPVEVVPPGAGLEVAPAELTIPAPPAENARRVAVRLNPAALLGSGRRVFRVRVAGASAAVVAAAAEPAEADVAAARHARWGAWGAAGVAAWASAEAGLRDWGPAHASAAWIGARVLRAHGALHPLADWFWLVALASAALRSGAWRARRRGGPPGVLGGDRRWNPAAAAGAVALAAWPLVAAAAFGARGAPPGGAALACALGLALVPPSAWSATVLGLAARRRLRAWVLRRGTGAVPTAAAVAALAVGGAAAVTAALALLQLAPAPALRALAAVPTPLGLLLPRAR